MTTLHLPAPARRAARARATHTLIPWLLLGFTILCYAGIVGNSFMSEDFLHAWRLVPPTGYRPLALVYWTLTGQVSPFNPIVYRLAILGLHLLNGCLVFALTRQLTARQPMGNTPLSLLTSSLAALVFLAVPTSAETVNWLAAACSYVLCTNGYLLGLIAFVDLVRAGRRPGRVKSYALCLAGMLFALFSNEVGLLWPFAALTLAWGSQAMAQTTGLVAPARDLAGLRLVLTTRAKTLVALLRLGLPLWIAWVAFVVLRTIVLKGIGAYGADVHLRAGWFLIGDVWTYISLFTAPLAQLPGPGAFFALVQDPLAGALALVVLVIVLWPVRKQVVFTLILLLPALNIPSYYRGYVAGAGFAMCLALVYFRLALRLRAAWGERAVGAGIKRVAHAVLVTLIVALSAWFVAGAYGRNAVWSAGSDHIRKVLATTLAAAPAPARDTRFYFFNLPVQINGAYTLHWGLREAIQSTYNDRTLDAYRIYSKPDPGYIQRRLETTLDAIAADSRYPQVFFVYQGEAGNPIVKLVPRSEFEKLVQNSPN